MRHVIVAMISDTAIKTTLVVQSFQARAQTRQGLISAGMQAANAGPSVEILVHITSLLKNVDMAVDWIGMHAYHSLSVWLTQFQWARICKHSIILSPSFTCSLSLSTSLRFRRFRVAFLPSLCCMI